MKPEPPWVQPRVITTSSRTGRRKAQSLSAQNIKMMNKEPEGHKLCTQQQIRFLRRQTFTHMHKHTHTSLLMFHWMILHILVLSGAVREQWSHHCRHHLLWQRASAARKSFFSRRARRRRSCRVDSCLFVFSAFDFSQVCILNFRPRTVSHLAPVSEARSGSQKECERLFMLSLDIVYGGALGSDRSGQVLRGRHSSGWGLHTCVSTGYRP